MRKFKELNSSVYCADEIENFVQPCFVGLIELFAGFSKDSIPENNLEVSEEDLNVVDENQLAFGLFCN